MIIQAGVITVSDKGSAGQREDQSGPEVERILKTIGIAVIRRAVVPDEIHEIQGILVDFADHHKIDLIVTTGGTGVAPRDVTPDDRMQPWASSTRKSPEWRRPCAGRALKSPPMP